MKNNEIILDDDLPAPQERAELATEQEQVREMIKNTVGELNTYLAHAAQIGMMVDLQELNPDIVGIDVPRKIITVVRVMARVGYRRPK